MLHRSATLGQNSALSDGRQHCPSVKTRGSVLRRARWRTDQGMPEPEASGFTNAEAPRRPGDHCCFRWRLQDCWRQGGAALDPCDARGVTPGTPREKPGDASVRRAVRGCCAAAPFARSVRSLPTSKVRLAPISAARAAPAGLAANACDIVEHQIEIAASGRSDSCVRVATYGFLEHVRSGWTPSLRSCRGRGSRSDCRRS